MESSVPSLQTCHEQRQLDVLRICSFVATPLLLVLIAVQAYRGDDALMLDALVFGALVSLACHYLAVVGLYRRWVVRMALVYFVWLAYVYLFRDYSASSLLFFLLFPFYNTMLLGLREGLAWNLAIGTSTGALMLPIPALNLVTLTHTGVDYMVAFLLATGCAYAWQRSRAMSLAGWKARVVHLEERLSLLESRGALPELVTSCAGCKNMRNPAGRWEPMEAFVENVFNTVVTHGFCPDCRDEFLSNYTGQ